ncbi:hypothetical protein [Actinocrispum sp. NPDC049592]|uniref:hypothetical protein n=1 Tax=Actinocrispum sp. NPDC049592 TaxID=3154835 RepID=UPI0034417DE9
METEGSISAAEASAALAATRSSRARVAWAGYPAWYWLLTGAGLGVLSVALLLPKGWALAAVAVTAGVLVGLAWAASRARGVCEYWTRSAMRWREVVALYGPVAVVLLANAFVARYASWSPFAAAALVFLLFAGTGLLLSARAARR